MDIYLFSIYMKKSGTVTVVRVHTVLAVQLTINYTIDSLIDYFLD